MGRIIIVLRHIFILTKNFKRDKEETKEEEEDHEEVGIIFICKQGNSFT